MTHDPLLIVTSSYAFHPHDALSGAGVFVRDFARALRTASRPVTVITQQKPTPLQPDPELALVAYRWSDPGRPGSYP